MIIAVSVIKSFKYVYCADPDKATLLEQPDLGQYCWLTLSYPNILDQCHRFIEIFSQTLMKLLFLEQSRLTPWLSVQIFQFNKVDFHIRGVDIHKIILLK